MRRAVVVGVVLAVLLFATRAAAEPIHLTVPVTCHDDAGHELRLAPGYFLDEDAWDHLDLETKRLQDAETRLSAENKVLRGSARPAWYWIASALVVGAAAGYATAKLL